ncbi:MAG: hypothetical protein EA377_04170 [Phycisphaerales bacterium]|nr:MAG: hypothetical protein EA377_04170 [Phycisphaerales bacterium]
MSAMSRSLLFISLVLATIGHTAAVADTPAGDTVQSYAAQIGISPEALAASGITSSAVVHQVLQQIADAEPLQEYQTAKAQLQGTGEQLQTIQAAIATADSETSSLNNDLATAINDFMAAEQSLKSAIAQLQEAAIEGLDSSTKQKLTYWFQSTPHDLPAAFRVISEPAEGWDQVRTALRHEARSLRMEEPVEPWAQTLLDSIRNQVDVINAENAIDLQLAQIKTAYNNFVPE